MSSGDGLVQTEDILLKTKDNLLTTADNGKWAQVNIPNLAPLFATKCLYCGGYV